MEKKNNRTKTTNKRKRLDAGNRTLPVNPHNIKGDMRSVGKPKYFVFRDNNYDGVTSPPRFSRVFVSDVRNDHRRLSGTHSLYSARRGRAGGRSRARASASR